MSEFPKYSPEGRIRAPYSHELYAMARHILVRCDSERTTMIECKKKHDFPEDCEPEAEALIRATNKLYGEVMEASPVEFTSYAACLDWWGLRMSRCRDFQGAFEKSFPLKKPM